MKDSKKLKSESDYNLDFILNHFREPHFPRTISTRTSQGRQFKVNNKSEALARFEQANFLDCKISAYPVELQSKTLSDFDGINRHQVDFIFAGDLDKSKFRTLHDLDRALKYTTRKIKQDIGGTPTSIWSGNGYHVYQPIEPAPLLEFESFFVKRFSESEMRNRLSIYLMRYAEYRFTNGKTDTIHNTTQSLEKLHGSNSRVY